MKIKRIHTWGTAGIGNYTVRVRNEETAVEAAIRSYERRTGLRTWHTVCRQGVSLSNGRPESAHYSVAVGRYCRDGTLSVSGQLWLAVYFD